jgi:hypothetical protein
MEKMVIFLSFYELSRKIRARNMRGCKGTFFLPLLDEAGGRNVGGGGSKAVVDAAQHLLGTTFGVLIAY